MRRDPEVPYGVIAVVAAIFIAITLFLVIGPYYNVWSSRLAGQATQARSQAEKQVRVEEARAKLEAAKLLADAEIEQARGAAAANAQLIEGLGGPDNYIRWRYIQMLETTAEWGSGRTIIYVPTEGQIPIMEAARVD